jgi:hypothetical protein
MIPGQAVCQNQPGALPRTDTGSRSADFSASSGTRKSASGWRRWAGANSLGVASIPARVGDKLVSTSFLKSCTRGFAAVDEPNVAVCLLPGTELAFEENLRCESAYGFGFKRLPHKMARFRQVNKEQREAETQLKYRRTLPRCNG